MLDGRWRAGVDRGTEPLGVGLRRMGLTANQLTLLGLLLALGAALTIGSGHLVWGVVLLTASGLTDLFDGPVAKAGGTASTRGAYFDSVADRVTDSLLFGATAWYLLSTHRGHLALLPVALLAAAFLVSYQRAKAESLGLDARGGVMERAERLILLGVGLAFASVLLVPVLWLLVALTAVTVAQRFVSVLRQAEAPPSPIRPARSELRWRQGRVDSRWRGWREAAVLRTARTRRTGTTLGRWRARRQGVLASRSGRIGRMGRVGTASSGSSQLGRAARSTGGRRVGEALRRRVDGGS